MTYAEWLACDDPLPMLRYVQTKGSPRKLRLFACAACRRIWHLLTDARSRFGVETAERFADGLATPGELSAAWGAADEAAHDCYVAVWSAAEAEAIATDLGEDSVHGAWECAMDASAAARAVPATADSRGDFVEAARCARRGLEYAASPLLFTEECNPSFEERNAVSRAEQVIQCQLLQDIFGHLFSSRTVKSAWLAWESATVRKIAQVVYDERDFDRLPILADALEDAGCANTAILDHCRGPGPHVRGCWVIDLLLGKS
jgi:hypothetical protein